MALIRYRFSWEIVQCRKPRVKEFVFTTPSLVFLTVILIYARLLVHIGHIWPYSDTCISVAGETGKSKMANRSQTITPTDAILRSNTVLEDIYLVMTSCDHAHFRFGRHRPPTFIFETRFSPKRLRVLRRFLLHLVIDGRGSLQNWHGSRGQGSTLSGPRPPKRKQIVFTF